LAPTHEPITLHQLRELEARLANADARLTDAERQADEYRRVIKETEAKTANAEARLLEAEQRAKRYLEEREDILAERVASVTVEPTATSDQSLSPLESLLDEYGLSVLARIVERRRLVEERDLRLREAAAAKPMGETGGPIAPTDSA
jgi:chromosome segregation ATPase